MNNCGKFVKSIGLIKNPASKSQLENWKSEKFLIKINWFELQSNRAENVIKEFYGKSENIATFVV